MSRDDPKASAERMQLLLDRWRQSLELHTRYLGLDDAHYWHVQPWPPHERPATWIVQLARHKIAELARALAEHTADGDLQFAVGLEQMAFLSNLVGLQPAGRHLPLADPQNEQPGIMPDAGGPTREMPRPRGARNGARAHRTGRNPRPSTARAARPAPVVVTIPAEPPLSAVVREVVQDGIRLMQWGRKWHELGELISRLPSRPGVGEIRRILRANRARIETAVALSGSAPAM